MIRWLWRLLWGYRPAPNSTTCQCGHGLCFHDHSDGDVRGCGYSVCYCRRFVPDALAESERLLIAHDESRAAEKDS